ncbi:hypothetical protein [Rickettsiella endosymbiont of Rhagonycha lignosa]|uniref:hypothetical protein n=1 Tax=Rickettsiella endosymbiont of Rhagonycha lignosa TaxID=3077937 RepID=UPI00313D736E
MPNNGNNYRIKLEFASFLRGIPEFIIGSTELEAYVEVTIQPLHPCHFLAYFRRSPTPQRLIEQLFQELEKDYIEPAELIQLGRMFKKYWFLIKQVQNDRAYYAITPGMMTGFFIILHTCLLIFPASKTLIYGNLIADFYSLSFWLFSIWSINKNERALHELEGKLMEKINFLKLLFSSMSSTDENYPESLSSLSLLPTYEDVLLEDAIRDHGSTIPIGRANGPSLFYVPVINNPYDNVNIHGDHSQFRSERCYSI